MSAIVYCVCREASLEVCRKCEKAKAIGASAVKKHCEWAREEWPIVK
jgi:hypothetical protein